MSLPSSPAEHPRGPAERRGRSLPRLLRVLLVVVGGIAVAGGGAGAVLGAVTSADPQQIATSTASEYRFLSGVWAALGLVLWWSLVRPVARATTTRVVIIVAIAGGVARLVSLVVDGWPGPFVAALVVELIVLPALLWWHVRAMSTHAPRFLDFENDYQ